MAGTLNEVTDTNFQAEVIESEGPCSSTSGRPGAVPACGGPGTRGDCLRAPDLRIVKLNIDENQQTAANFSALDPTMILFKAASRSRRLSCLSKEKARGGAGACPYRSLRRSLSRV